MRNKSWYQCQGRMRSQRLLYLTSSLAIHHWQSYMYNKDSRRLLFGRLYRMSNKPIDDRCLRKWVFWDKIPTPFPYIRNSLSDLQHGLLLHAYRMVRLERMTKRSKDRLAILRFVFFFYMYMKGNLLAAFYCHYHHNCCNTYFFSLLMKYNLVMVTDNFTLIILQIYYNDV